jgi:tRNA modification GTPase
VAGSGRAILLTPPGGAAIAVIRLVGPGVGSFLSRHFSKAVRAGRCVHGELSDAGNVIDDPVVVLSEDRQRADVNLHGGPWVVQSALELARREGFEVEASPGLPLPADAVDSEGDLEREVLTHLPMARTELGVRVLLAQVEAWGRLDPATDARRVLEDRGLWWLLHPPRVAVVGAANVGKSTLANRLFAQERSVTADLPGTTRDWVGEMADVNGLPVMLVDTPGLRRTDDAIERDAIEAAGGEIRRADLVVLVLDATRPLGPEQAALLEAHPEAIVVVNKCDVGGRWDPSPRANVRTVAITGEGVDGLRSAIAARFGCDRMEMDRPHWWTERQRTWLRLRCGDPPVP